MQAPAIDLCTLIVNYVPTIVGNEELAAIFSPFGKITLARVIYDRASGEHRGFGFVRYATEGPALAAMQALNGLEIEKKRLKISYAHANAQDPQVEGSLMPTRTANPTAQLSPAAASSYVPAFFAAPHARAIVPCAPLYAPALPPTLVPLPSYQLVPMPAPAYMLVPIASPAATERSVKTKSCWEAPKDFPKKTSEVSGW